MRILVLDTSTERGFVAFIENETVKASIELPFGYNQSKYLIPSIQELTQQYSLGSNKIDCIGVGIGPGSYTGIRIGAAAAKSLAYGWSCPLVGVSTLMAFTPKDVNVPFAAIFDAKIGGAYMIRGQAKNGIIQYDREPQAYPLLDLGDKLHGVEILVTPSQKALKQKLDTLYPSNHWLWEENSPSITEFGLRVAEKFHQGDLSRDGQLELLYLRKTEAELERERELKDGKN